MDSNSCRMQTLGISDSTEHSESRLKALFWPSVKSGADVDYLGTQGFWVCAFVAVFTLLTMSLQGRPILAVVLFLFFYLGGVGVRERSPFAAIIVFVFYALDTLISVLLLFLATPWGMLVVRLFITALLLSNVRATWMAATWKPDSEEAVLPPRLGEFWTDKIADQIPAKIWPKLRIPYYIFAPWVLLLSFAGVAVVLARSFRH